MSEDIHLPNGNVLTWEYIKKEVPFLEYQLKRALWFLNEDEKKDLLVNHIIPILAPRFKPDELKEMARTEPIISYKRLRRIDDNQD